MRLQIPRWKGQLLGAVPLTEVHCISQCTCMHAHTHTHTVNGPLNFVQDYPGEPVPQPIWILPKQETVSGSGISWAIYKSAPCPRQITMAAPHHSVFTGQMPFLLPNQQHQSTEGTMHIPNALQCIGTNALPCCAKQGNIYIRTINQWKPLGLGSILV